MGRTLQFYGVVYWLPTNRQLQNLKLAWHQQDSRWNGYVLLRRAAFVMNCAMGILNSPSLPRGKENLKKKKKNKRSEEKLLGGGCRTGACHMSCYPPANIHRLIATLHARSHAFSFSFLLCTNFHLIFTCPSFFSFLEEKI